MATRSRLFYVGISLFYTEKRRKIHRFFFFSTYTVGLPQVEAPLAGVGGLAEDGRVGQGVGFTLHGIQIQVVHGDKDNSVFM